MDKLSPKYRNQLLLLRCSQPRPEHNLLCKAYRGLCLFLWLSPIGQMGQNFPTGQLSTIS